MFLFVWIFSFFNTIIKKNEAVFFHDKLISIILETYNNTKKILENNYPTRVSLLYENN